MIIKNNNKPNSSLTLSDIVDVDVTNKTDGYALQYDPISRKFVSKPLPAGSGGGAINTNAYVIELSRWNISNNGTNPLSTTRGINNALVWANTNGYTYIKLPAGTYMIGKGTMGTIAQGVPDTSIDASIQPQNDTTLDLYGCIIQKETNGWEKYNIIRIKDKKNITLLGGKIVGDVYPFGSNILGHDFTSPDIHEGCIGVNVDGSKNVTLENMEITSCAGYSTCLTGTFSQLAVTSYSNWEVGGIDGSGVPKVDASLMRMNTYILLSTLTNAVISGGVHDNATTNGGYFVIWGSGYGTHGTRYDSKPVNLSRSVFLVHCYDANNVYKGVVRKRGVDAIYIDTLPSGTTKFKLSVGYDLTQIIPSTLSFQINAFTFSTNIVIRNCKIHDSFSLAIAITGAQRVLIENCEMYRIGNATTIIGRRLYPFPMAIDIEDGAIINQHTIIRNNVFRDNESLHISASHVRNLIIENNRFDAPTNGLNSGVAFQGSRGANLISKNNYYNCAVGTGQGGVIFQNDLFTSGQLQMQYDATYVSCAFHDSSFILATDTYGIWSATSYAVTTPILPVDKTGAWRSNPLYYVVLTAGATLWGNKRYFVNDLVIVIIKDGNGVITSNRVYKCTIAPTTNSVNQPLGTATTTNADGYTWQFTADNIEPTWKTDGSNTTDNANNVWQSFPYLDGSKNYDIIRFKDCKFTCTGDPIASGFMTRRGAVEFEGCKFSLAKTFFIDGSEAATLYWDYPNKNSFKFYSCQFEEGALIGTIKGNTVSFVNTIFNGKKNINDSTAVISANELIVSGCTFNNFNLKLKGNRDHFVQNSVSYPSYNSVGSRSVYITNNTMYIKKTVRATGLNNECLFVQNFENAFIENNKAFMLGSTANVRALTIYVEKFLNMSGNYFESDNNLNKLELFGALRDAEYTIATPATLTAVIDKNYAKQYAILADATYTTQVTTSIGSGVTAVT